MELIEPDDDRWHDKLFDFAIPFTCDHCGHEGHTGEADARCEECGHTTRLAYEVEP